MNPGLELLQGSGAVEELKNIRRGIEKESLRIDASGNLSKLSHPKGLGSALTNPFITTDFSEALVELVTPTFTNTFECLEFLTEIHAFVYKQIEDELLWPCSMPCPISSEEDIPIGNYGSSNPGTLKTIYRKGLSHRYGGLMQTISGIHYNFSFPERFFEKIQKNLKKKEVGLKDLKNETYLSIARNFKRHEWLYFLLFGASPAICDSFIKSPDHDFEILPSGGLYKPNATSLRMGEVGYISKVQENLNISMNSLKEYCEDLKLALTDSYTPYKKIGEFKKGERIQLNTAIIQIENEYYNTIRPKRICPQGERPISILKKEGINYLELRCVDIDPFVPIGIERDQTDFIDMLLLFCFLEDSPPIERSEMEQIRINHNKVINQGRDQNLMLYHRDTKVRALDLASTIFDKFEEMIGDISKEIFGVNKNFWKASLKIQKEKLLDLNRTPSGKILNHIEKEKKSFKEFGLELSELHSDFFKNYKQKENETLKKAASLSFKTLSEIELKDNLPFEEYLSNFLNKTT